MVLRVKLSDIIDVHYSIFPKAVSFPEILPRNTSMDQLHENIETNFFQQLMNNQVITKQNEVLCYKKYINKCFNEKQNTKNYSWL